MSALHRMGKVNFVSSSKPAKASTSVNVVYRKPKPKKGYRKKAQVGKSFRIAYNKMQPSKEIRFEVSDGGMNTSTSVASRTQAVLLDNITQGTQLNHRLQSNIHISYVQLRGTIQSNSTAKAKAMRVMIFREINNGGVNTSTYADLWKGPGSGTTYAPTGTASDIAWPLNRELVQPLYDKTYVIKPEYEGLTYFRKSVRVNKLVKYPVNDATDNTPYHGRLLLLYCLSDCDSTTSATTVILTSSARVFFKDYHKAR